MRSAGDHPPDETPGQAVVAGPPSSLVSVTRSNAFPTLNPLPPPTIESVLSRQPSSEARPLGLEATVELTSRARGGDQAALEALCLRCLKSLSRYAAGRLPRAVRDMLDTQDVVVEAVQRGMCRLHEFEYRQPGALVAYMRTILRNLIIDHVRARSKRPQQALLDDQHADRGRSPLERVLDEEQIELYEAALARLRPRDAALVALRIEEQLGHDAIALELGFPSANTARVAAKRAVLRLAHEMSRLSHTKSHTGMRDVS